MERLYKEDVLNCLGRFPNKVELSLRTLKKEDMGNYERHLIEYTVEKHNDRSIVENIEIFEKVQAYLLIPKDIKEKAPAILAIHQHASNWEVGKSEVVGLTNNQMYSYGLDLVNRGYVVIAPDLLCFESRMGSNQYRDSKEGNRNFEKFEALQYLMLGSTIQAKTLHDLSCAIDVLQSLNYVDQNRIGVIGHSLGGQESIWLEWFDPRIKVGVSSCGVSCIKDILENGIIHNMWLYIPRLLEICDMDEIINEIVKDRKLMITSGLRDGRHFPLSGIEKIEHKVGSNKNFISIKFDDEHNFNDSEKKIAYEFLDSVLIRSRLKEREKRIFSDHPSDDHGGEKR